MSSEKDLDSKDLERYDRQMMIQDFGEEGQEKLKSTTALVAGAGGLDPGKNLIGGPPNL